MLLWASDCWWVLIVSGRPVTHLLLTLRLRGCLDCWWRLLWPIELLVLLTPLLPDSLLMIGDVVPGDHIIVLLLLLYIVTIVVVVTLLLCCDAHWLLLLLTVTICCWWCGTPLCLGPTCHLLHLLLMPIWRWACWCCYPWPLRCLGLGILLWCHWVVDCCCCCWLRLLIPFIVVRCCWLLRLFVFVDCCYTLIAGIICCWLPVVMEFVGNLLLYIVICYCWFRCCWYYIIVDVIVGVVDIIGWSRFIRWWLLHLLHCCSDALVIAGWVQLVGLIVVVVVSIVVAVVCCCYRCWYCCSVLTICWFCCCCRVPIDSGVGELLTYRYGDVLIMDVVGDRWYVTVVHLQVPPEDLTNLVVVDGDGDVAVLLLRLLWLGRLILFVVVIYC